MKKLTCVLFLFLTFHLSAQEAAEEAAIRAVIQKLFDGMRAGDSSMVRSVFNHTARLQTTYTDRLEGPVLKTETIEPFIEAVGKPHDQVWDERIWSHDINIDGHLATVWTAYTFFVGDVMSHCGVNAFQLFNGSSGWKIIQITDTRRRDGCQVEEVDEAKVIGALLDRWHQAAASADEDTFFDSTMAKQAIYLGTDATEKWERDELQAWSKEFFARESAWAFTPKNRAVYLAKNGKSAWFDESLDTWMGECRGSGVLRKNAEGWKLVHYNLAVTVPNEVMDGFIELVKNAPEKKD